MTKLYVGTASIERNDPSCPVLPHRCYNQRHELYRARLLRGWARLFDVTLAIKTRLKRLPSVTLSCQEAERVVKLWNPGSPASGQHEIDPLSRDARGNGDVSFCCFDFFFFDGHVTRDLWNSTFFFFTQRVR